MSMLKRIERIERAIIFACSLIIAFTFCLVVLLRYVFHSDLFAYEEWILTVAFLLYFTGGAAATASNAHIKADILLELLRTQRAKNALQCAVMALEAIIGAFLTYYAVLMVMNEFARWPNIPATPVYAIPLAAPRIFILIGFALMTLHAAIHAARFYALARRGEPTGPIRPRKARAKEE